MFLNSSVIWCLIIFIRVKANFDTPTQTEFIYKDKDTLEQKVLNVILHLNCKTRVNIV